MLGIVLGPPPDGALEHESGRKWRGANRLRKIIWAEMRTNERKALMLGDIEPDTRLSVMVRPKLLDQQDLYGGRVGRDMLIRPALEEHQFPPMPWTDLFQPIQAWEAWQVAESEGMVLQGIEYNHPDGRYILHLEDLDDHGSLTLDIKPKGSSYEEREELTEQLLMHLEHASVENQQRAEMLVDNNPYLEDYETVLALLTLDEKFIDHQMPNLGWRLSNVWKMDEENVKIQAKEFGFKKGRYLLERLARRKAAADRKRTHDRR